MGMLTLLPFKSFARRPEELNESGLTDINDESDCDEKNEIPEEVTRTKKNLPIKVISGGVSQH